jgi:hypothetical protein
MKREDLSPIEIEDLATLQKAIADAYSRFEDVIPLWRGHSNIDWKLQAEVFRPIAGGATPDEVTLLGYFMAHAESRHPRCPRTDDRVAWLMFARHYGLPTCLLDWTWSPLIAMYFACQDERFQAGADGCLWALEPGLMNFQMSGSRRMLMANDPAVQPFVEIAFEPRQAVRISKAGPLQKKALAIGMREIDARVFAQQAACTIHADTSDLSDVDYSTDASGQQVVPWRRLFRVPANKKRTLQEHLRRLSIHRATLFPDLGALTEELKGRNYLRSD